MRRPQKIMPDITRDSIEEAFGDVHVGSLKLESKRETMATGDIRAVPVATGLLVLIGDFKGQVAYDAQVTALPGLTVEIRLRGRSKSTVLKTPDVWTEVRPGDYLVSAFSGPEPIRVIAPAQQDFQAVSVCFSLEYIENLGDAKLLTIAKSLFEDGIRFQGSAPMRLQSLAEQICVADPNQDLALVKIQAACVSLLAEVISLNMQDTAHPSVFDDKVVAIAKDFILQETAAHLTVADVAAHCRISASVLKTIFRAVEGTPIGTFIRENRMEAAKTMLDEGVSITRVAEVLQYSAPEALTRAFSRHYGYPPSRAGQMRTGQV